MPGSPARTGAAAPRPRAWWTFAVTVPLALFLLVTFVGPVAMMLVRGFTNPELPALWPQTVAAMERWNGTGLPDDGAARAVAQDIAATRRAGTLSQVANRLNYDMVGSRSLLYRTADRLDQGAAVSGLADLGRIDRRWQDRRTWAAIRHGSAPITSFYLWAALDRRMDADGTIQRIEPAQAVFVDVLLRTFKISLVVALLCALLGYPLAYLLATQPERRANLLLILVLLPFWTSALVRTTAWVVLLQSEGVVNNMLQQVGAIDAPLALIYNRLGVYIAMTHVLLPFLVLPLYGVMRGISTVEMRAASSLGANPFTVFRRIYFPQTLPGLIAGMIIVFTLALGYYITPALVGGGADQMISGSIAFYTNQSLNWGMAAALSVLLMLPLAMMLYAGRYLTRAVPA
jgi:putative spermidine/putrescine transport system permease protein